MRLVTHRLTIAAPALDVYRLLTTVDGLLRWIGVQAIADAEPGGRLQWTHEDGSTMIGRFVELIPSRRVVFTYGWKDSLMGVPPESTTVEIELVEHAGRTTLTLTHRGLPPDADERHRSGWGFFLGRLREAFGPPRGG
jgi:uncharacterized protein YndB with AHSA1/START domain